MKRSVTRLFRRWTGPKSAATEAAERPKTLSVHCPKTDSLEQKIRSVFLPTTPECGGYFAPR